VATHLDPHFGIRSAPFLDRAFKIVEFRICVTIHDDGNWVYEEDSVLMIQGRNGSLHHADRNVLCKVANPPPIPWQDRYGRRASSKHSHKCDACYRDLAECGYVFFWTGVAVAMGPFTRLDENCPTGNQEPDAICAP
jgi:hypothetical protein